jgi:hypothetical protein
MPLCASCGVPVRAANLERSEGTPITIEARPDPHGDLVVMGWAEPAVVIRVGPDDFPDEPHFRQHSHEMS